MNLFKYIKGSLDNSNTGASGKKLTALFATVFCFVTPIVSWTYWAYTHNDWNLLTGVLVIVVSFISALFGINVIDKFKNKDNTPTE